MTDWNDKEQVLKAVSAYGYELKNASEELKADREIVLAAIQNDSDALKYASKELRAAPSKRFRGGYQRLGGTTRGTTDG